MTGAIYYLSLPLIYFISWLPFTVLYWLSDFFYFLVYKVLKYRVGVVHENLKNSFPEKSEEEIKAIQDGFYSYFCDLLLETLKTLTIKPKTVLKRVEQGDMSAFDSFYKKGQSVIIVMGHLGNWELAGARFSQGPEHQLYVIYHPLSNKYFDKLVYHMRTRLGNKLYPMQDAFRGMVRDRNEVTATAFIADQTPAPKGAYWSTFLNQETPIFVGTSKIAKKLGYPVIYISVDRVKRGYYKLNSELLIEDPKALEEDAITEIHTRKLEEDIKRKPELWLWSHRRWKHKNPNKIEDNNVDR